MYSYGSKSLRNLSTAHSDFQEIFNEAIKHKNIIILCGHRTESEQNTAYANGHSKARWGQSPHNTSPSNAVDAAIWHPDKPHIHWNDKMDWYELAYLILGIAETKGKKIKWGGMFKNFFDGPHFERIVE